MTCSARQSRPVLVPLPIPLRRGPRVWHLAPFPPPPPLLTRAAFNVLDLSGNQLGAAGVQALAPAFGREA